MASISETQLLTEINELILIYKDIVIQLENNHFALTSVREQFPSSFLEKTGIEAFLKRKANITKTKLDKSIKKIKKSKAILDNALNKLKNEVDEEKKQQLQIQIKKHQDIIKEEETIYYMIKKLKFEASPEKVLYFYEDLLLFTATCKHESLTLWKNCIATYDDLKINEEHFSARFLIDVSEEALRNKGFQKVSQDVRDAYIKSLPILKDLKKLANRAKGLRDTSKKLLDSFESDEVNYRRFADRNTRIMGI